MKTFFTILKKIHGLSYVGILKFSMAKGLSFCHSYFMATTGTESWSIQGKADSQKKPVIHSTASCYFRGVSTITSTHDSEQAWLVNPIFSNSELRNLQEILLTVVMLVGLEIGRTNTETVGVLKQWSPELSEAWIAFIV